MARATFMMMSGICRNCGLPTNGPANSSCVVGGRSNCLSSDGYYFPSDHPLRKAGILP
ncbi:hypothetical protein GMO_02270 [Gluconobacter morbifer G707]|uniref:Uncharacterized protein n=1 Tax=Gluconobacter morbifer G707 TaxID=1088869 RepID=G6XFG2_9PROT|nr:hypothetical protein GMO_02270 [Gluconobacter morbifer G707]